MTTSHSAYSLPDSLPSTVDRPDGMLERPVFLVGSERSGTTLLRLMLDHHPQIAFFFEFQYAVSMMPDTTGWPDLKAYREFCENDRIFRDTRLKFDESLDYPHLIDSFLRQKQLRDGKPLVGAVVHYQFDRLLRIWPDARFIHLVRDGRDVARSVITNGLAGNMYTAAQTWMKAETLWSSFARELPADRWTAVRYEDLVTKPETILTHICEFIGVAYDPAMLEYSKDSTYEAPSPARMYQWKTRLNPDEIRLAEARIGSLLVERGYERSDYAPLEVSLPAKIRLHIQDRLYRISFRRRKYGTRLWLAKAVARRLRLHSWQKALQRRIDAIDERHLK